MGSDRTDLIGRILKIVSYPVREDDLGMDVPVAGENMARDVQQGN